MIPWNTGETTLWHLTEDGPVRHREIDVTSVVMHEVKVTFGALMPHDLLVSFPGGSDWVITHDDWSQEEFIEKNVVVRFRGCMVMEGYIGALTQFAAGSVQSIRIAVVLFCEGGMWIK